MKRWLLALSFLAIAAQSDPCRGDLMLVAPTLDVAAGATGSFDLILVNTNALGGDSYSISGTVLELALTGPSGVQFTDVSIATTLPYLFLDPGVNNGGGPFSFDSFPSTSFMASDSEFAAAGFAMIRPGEQFAVAHVSFAVDPATTGGVWSLTFGAGTSLLDLNGEVVPLVTRDGSIRVSSVPEPSAGLLLAMGLAGFMARRRRRDRVG